MNITKKNKHVEHMLENKKMKLVKQNELIVIG